MEYKQLIADLKDKLHKTINEKQNLIDEEVLQISYELDKLIFEYYKSLFKN